jgi:hypothetical protein
MGSVETGQGNSEPKVKKWPLAGIVETLKKNRESIATLATGVIYQATGFKRYGDKLVEKLGSENESVATIAAMSLVRKQSKAEPLLREDLANKGGNLPMVIDVLSGTANATKYKEDFVRLAQSDDPRVAESAKWALRGVDNHQNPI